MVSEYYPTENLVLVKRPTLICRVFDTLWQQGHGSFRRVSEVLMLRQSALSRCISQLEHSLGMTDFERSSGGVQATTVGRDFLRTVCG